MQRRQLLKGVGVLSTTALAGCEGRLIGEPTMATDFSDSYPVSPETKVAISNRNGPVTVHPTDNDQLQILGSKQANSQSGLDSIDIEVITGERFVINVRFAAGSDFANRSVDLDIGIPTGVNVDIVNTANGDVTVRGVRGDVNATTVNGTVQLQDISGFVRGSSTNGNVTVQNCTGITGARTTNGSVEVDILAMRENVHCQSSNGNVVARVGPDISAAIRLSTNTGTAQVQDLSYTTTVSKQGYIVGSLRGGQTPLLFLGTNNGDVTLKPI
ncbi:MAG: DUF4097 family beta strand repeat-containing protein [Halobacteriaceae archaeon]